jgi:hypothetical protein
MTWTELCRHAAHTRSELLLLDSGLEALGRSSDAWLHASMAATVPTLENLCALLDAHGVPVASGLEAQVLMPFRFAPRRDANDAQIAMGVRAVT